VDQRAIEVGETTRVVDERASHVASQYKTIEAEGKRLAL
jgi:hypothetical protein